MTDVQIVELPVHVMDAGEKRFDASFYAQDVVNARILIERLQERGIRIAEVDNLASDIFHRPRFKRKYVSRNRGIPFLTPTDLFMFPLKPRKYVVDPPAGLMVKPEWILITCSGTVGRCIISNSRISECVLSHDVIRVLPQSSQTLGYLYAYFNTWIGQVFLTKDRYGATVKHIEPHHVSSVPIPLIPEIGKEVTENILESFRLREEAQKDYLQAENMIYSELGLAEIDEEEVEYYGGEVGAIVKSFEIRASELKTRLDASYHLPILYQIEDNLTNAVYGFTNLENTIDKIFIPNRFKRPYVNNEKIGTPFLQGSHVPLVRPMDVKYLWKRTKNLGDTLIEKDWVLMTRSGTVGKIAIVRDGLHGWAASEHILRIIVKESIHPGYIAAFLSCPYGEYQIKGKVYGAVVDEIGEQDTSLIEEINITLPPENVRNEIGQLFSEAYDKRDRANSIEDETIELLEGKMAEIATG